MVRYKNHGTYKSFDEFGDAIINLYTKVGSAALDEEEEGSVLYFVQRNSRNSKLDRVLSLCKLKTFEYRVWRKLREKLSSHLNERCPNDKKQTRIDRFIKESKELTEGFNLPHSMNWYKQVAITAFDWIAENYKGLNEEDLRGHFINHLSYFVEKTHGEKLKCASSLQFNKTSTSVLKNTSRKQMIVMVPIGIPGMGKSTFVKIINSLLDKNGWEFFVLSADLMRSKMIEKYVKDFPSRAHEAHEKTQKSFVEKWNTDLAKVVQSCKSEKFCLFLDKNHPLNALDKTMDIVRNNYNRKE
mmetsp:Transcript_102523/g.221271  ORF Transcript_102523/g.221271 Transcript_102523/m.221271 type:complete len:299 (+) Transcript_102523:538-1434(+)|eukprot:CAMPEP_0116895534 /NCGR_PEP_ID=MMETSP0467-20121206/5041_1 /TAXON_ID=283647 /ORGANISM="Mesodinium pulex, Strain SPMC105" /LENGTH=298 /DNA_ID=CAMNT_0004566327 /DNA_START=833 /DNA_END=1729 /DNA_ORIENTATION=+